MGGESILKKILHGGPEHQERKKAEQEAKAEARKAELASFKKGLIRGATVKGDREGYAKGSARGGLMGAMEKVSVGMKAFEKGMGGFVGDIDLGNIGKGFGSGTILDTGDGTKKRRHHHRTHHRRSRR